MGAGSRRGLMGCWRMRGGSFTRLLLVAPRLWRELAKREAREEMERENRNSGGDRRKEGGFDSKDGGHSKNRMAGA